MMYAWTRSQASLGALHFRRANWMYHSVQKSDNHRISGGHKINEICEILSAHCRRQYQRSKSHCWPLNIQLLYSSQQLSLWLRIMDSCGSSVGSGCPCTTWCGDNLPLVPPVCSFKCPWARYWSLMNCNWCVKLKQLERSVQVYLPLHWPDV